MKYREVGMTKETTIITLRPVGVALLMACAVGCGSQNTHAVSSENTPSISAESPAPALTPHVAAESIKAAVPEVTSLVEITEDNDANNMIGRINGYVAATVLVDSRITEGCELNKPGIACGAGIEQWADEAAAQQRATYIKTLLSSAPILGTEYQTVKGNLVLRVSGQLKPSEAEAYQRAFTG
jgi:serine/threonine protein kinase, bacterial